MRRILKALGWLSLVLAALSLVLTAMAWPPGGLFFALPYIFLFASAGFGVVGGVLVLLTRPPRARRAADPSDRPSNPTGDHVPGRQHIDSDSVGDPALHLSLEALEAGLASLGPTPRDEGTVTHLVRRGPGGIREVLDGARLVRDGGLPGDQWGSKPGDPDTSLTVMEDGVARLIANGQPRALFGDQIFLDLDLSRANLPAGSRVRMGSATLVVTPTPHEGCQKFRARFGTAALRLVSGKEHRHLNLRGVHMRVVQDGDVAVGDAVTVVRRGEGKPEA